MGQGIERSTNIERHRDGRIAPVSCRQQIANHFSHCHLDGVQCSEMADIWGVLHATSQPSRRQALQDLSNGVEVGYRAVLLFANNFSLTFKLLLGISG